MKRFRQHTGVTTERRASASCRWGHGLKAHAAFMVRLPAMPPLEASFISSDFPIRFASFTEFCASKQGALNANVLCLRSETGRMKRM